MAPDPTGPELVERIILRRLAECLRRRMHTLGTCQTCGVHTRNKSLN